MPVTGVTGNREQRECRPVQLRKKVIHKHPFCNGSYPFYFLWHGEVCWYPTPPWRPPLGQPPLDGGQPHTTGPGIARCGTIFTRAGWILDGGRP